MMPGTDREPIAFADSESRALLRDIADAVIVADAAGGLIVFWNRAAERLFGYSSEEALAMSVEMIVVPRLRPMIRAPLAEFARTGDLADQRPLTLPMVCRNGAERIVELTLGPVGGADVPGRYLLAILRDVTDRMQLQAAARAERARFSSILETIADGVITWDRAGRVTRANAAAAAIFGLPSERLLTSDPGAFLLNGGQPTGNGLSAVASVFESVKTSGRAVHGQELQVERPDGTRGHLLVSAAPLVGPRGGFGGVVASFADITNRLQTEDQLRRSEAWLSLTLETSPDLICVLDTEGRYLYVNSAYRRDLGYLPDQLVGWPAASILHPKDAAALRQRLRALSLAGLDELAPLASQMDFACRIRHADGYYLNIECKWRVARGADGRPSGVIIVSRDVTDRVRAETALRESEERFRSYFQLGLVGMAITSPDRRYLEVNDQFCQILGYERDELLRMSWGELTHPDDLAAEMANVNRALAGEIDGYTLDKRLIRKDGRVVYTTISVRCLRRDDRSVDYFVALVDDVTERKRAEERQRALYSVTQLLAEADSLEHCVPSVLETLCETLEWDAAEFWQVDTRADVLHWAGGWSRPRLGMANLASTHRTATIARGEGLAGRAWADGTPQWCTDVEGAKADAPAGIAGGVGWRSAAAFPIRIDDRIRGVMTFTASAVRPPDAEASEVMDGIGRQIGQFLARKEAEVDRERLLSQEQIARLTAQLTAEALRRLQVITDTVLLDLPFERLSAELLLRVRTALGAEAAVLYLMNPEDGSMAVAEVSGRHLPPDERVLPPGVGVAGRVATTREPVVAEDVSASRTVRSVLGEQLHSLAAVPLLSEDRLLGVLQVAAVLPRAFTPDDMRLLKLAAERVAVALERTRVRAAEQEARREAEAAVQMQERALSLISHDISQPLGALHAGLPALRKSLGPLPRDVGMLLSALERATSRITAMTEELLDAAQLQAGRQLTLHRGKCNLVSLIKREVATLRRSARDRIIDVVADGTPIVGMWDASRLSRVLSNIISNALKYSPDESPVTVTVGRRGDGLEAEAVVSVIDSGIGIPEGDLPHVTQRFKRGSNVGAIRGTGLGLSGAKQMVEQHGGKLVIESHEGQGTTVTILLPLQSNTANK